nr:protein SPO16 homolog [Lytechinus pictus]
MVLHDYYDYELLGLCFSKCLILSTFLYTLIFLVSNTTVSSSIIFPLSSVAFLIVPIEKASLEWPPKSGRIQLDHEFLERVQKFVQIHRNSYMVLTSALHGPHEMAIIAAIQTRFIDHNLRILPVHNDSECLQTILTIAQATCTPTCNILRSRLDAILSRQNSAQMILNILSQLGLNHHHILTKRLKACSNRARKHSTSQQHFC